MLANSAEVPVIMSSNMPHQKIIFDDTKLFVNRKDDKKPINNSIDRLKEKRLQREQILNIIGVPGIGKSALFQDIYTFYYNDADILLLAYAVKKQDSTSILEHMSYSLAQQLSPYTKVPVQQISLRAIAQQLIDLGKSTHKPIVLLIDGCEYISLDERRTLEDDLLYPVVTMTESFILVSSQAEIRWSSYELRRRSMVAHELSRLAEEDTQKLVDEFKLSTEALYPAIRQTHGLPLAIVKLAESYRDGQAEHFLQETIKDIRQRSLETLHTNDLLWRLLQAISLLREFDVEMVQLILPIIEPKRDHISQADAFLYIRQLVETRLCRADEQIRAYRVPSPLRTVLAEAFQAENNVSITQSIHHRASMEYHQRIKTVPRSRNRYLMEYSYHVALYKLTTEAYNFLDEFQTLLDSYYASADKEYIDRQGLSQLKASLLEDTELLDALERHGISSAELSRTIDRLISYQASAN